MKLLRFDARPFKFDHAREYRQERERNHKPVGFWFSVDDDWKRWCEGEDFETESLECVREVELQPEAKILRIDSVKGLDRFTERFGTPDRMNYRDIAWREVAEQFDGIIIAPYQWERRLSLSWYYTWDCASGVVWNLRAIAAVQEASDSTTTLPTK